MPAGPSAPLSRPRGLLFAASLAVSLACWALAPGHLKSSVASDYAPQVQNLQEHGSFVTPDGHLLARYPPLFPALLAGAEEVAEVTHLGRDVVIALVLALLTAVSTVLVHVLATPLLSRRGAWIASALFLTHPFVLAGVLKPLSFVPFLPLLYGALVLFLRTLASGRLATAACVGALLGLSMLCRPISILLPLALLPLLLWRLPPATPWRRRALAGGVLLLATAVVLVPWQAAMVGHGEEGWLSTGGAASMRDGLTFNHKSFREPLDLAPEVAAISDRAWARYAELGSPAAVAGFVLEEWKADPGAVAKLLALKAGRAWFGTDSQDAGQERWNLVLLLLYVPLCVVGIVRAGRADRRRRTFALVSTVAILYFWLVTVVVLSIVRYMVPVLGLVVIGVVLAFERRRSAD